MSGMTNGAYSLFLMPMIHSFPFANAHTVHLMVQSTMRRVILKVAFWMDSGMNFAPGVAADSSPRSMAHPSATRKYVLTTRTAWAPL